MQPMRHRPIAHVCAWPAAAALKSEVSATEARLESERKAHQAHRAAAAARERDLEQQIAGTMAALADQQRSLEESNRKGRGAGGARGGRGVGGRC